VEAIYPKNLEELQHSLLQQLSASKQDWLNEAIKKIQAEPASQDSQLLLSASASRQLGNEPLPQYSGSWQIDDAARVLLLQEYLQLTSEATSPANKHDIIWQACRIGDENEKAAYMKGLSLLDPHGELLDLALHTGRTNNITLFSAIAQYNPYPAQHYDDRAFEQLVLKALFLGLDISYIEALSQRLHPELSNKCMDLVRERLAADRQPPISIWLAIDIRHLDEENQALYLEFIGDPSKEQRYYSLLSLKQLGLLQQYAVQLAPQKQVETEAAILQLLSAIR
jgi:hypothetical protein